MPVIPVSDTDLRERDYNVARFYFEASRLPEDTFKVSRFSGTEALSEPFAFELKLVSEDAHLDFAAVINQPAVFTMMRGDTPIPVAGIVTDFAQAGRAGENIAYQATLRPRLWRLSLTYQSRIFQNLMVEEILRAVFEEAGLASDDVRFELNEDYEPREYCVQFQETDLNFVSRLMEYEGLYYFFEHDDGRDVLVITDHRGSQPSIPSPADLYFHEGAGMVGERKETVKLFVCREQLVTGKVQLKDYNYRTPETNLMVESQLNAEMPGMRYEYGEHFQDTDQGRRLATVRNEEMECRRRVMRGTSDCPALMSGRFFELKNHFRDDLDGEYLVTGITHEGGGLGDMSMQWDSADGDAEGGDAGELVYRNRFFCIPVDVQFRPERTTPKPKAPGIMTARIESAGGDYAYIDAEGHYRAKMHFDTSDQSDGTASLPIRMNQPHAGADYGIHFPNHAGAEMLIACENGDIDRPVALGAVPNPSNTSPAVSENRMQNVVRTNAGNQLIMDDTIDKAQVQLNSADAHTVLLDDDEDRIHIASTEQHTVTLDDENQQIKVQTTDGHVVIMDDANRKVTVQSTDGHVISINDKDENITIADESGDNTFTIDIKNQKLVIKTATGDIDMHAPKGVIDVQAKELNIETSGDTNMKAANINSEAKSDHEMKATNITAKANMDYTQEGMNITSKASMEHSVEGMQVASKGAVKNDMEGAMVNVKASGINTIQGSLVKIN